MQQPEPASKVSYRWLILLLVIGLFIRVGFLYDRFGKLESSRTEDTDAYCLLAENLAVHGGFGHVDQAGKLHPTAFRPPAYPWLLSWLVVDGQLAALPIAIFHLLCGLGTIGLSFLIGHKTCGRRVGCIAALLVAVDPILLNQSTYVMTETLATLCVALAWWQICRIFGRTLRPAQTSHFILQGLALGATLAIGFLVRPIFIVWTCLIVLIAAIDWLRAPTRRWITIATTLAVLILVTGCWTVRNQSAVGKPVWATTHGGYTLLLGNNPSFYQYLASGKHRQKWDAQFFHDRWAQRAWADPRAEGFWDPDTRIDTSGARMTRSEIEDDRLAYEVAKATIAQNPSRFFHSCLVRVGRLWALLPHAGDQANAVRYAVAIFYIALFSMGLLGLKTLGTRLWHPHWAAAIAIGIALSGVHAVYWSNMRMRAPAIPMLAVAAAIGAERVVNRFASKA